MSALTIFFIMKLDAITAILFWIALLCLGYFFWQYAIMWLNAPEGSDSGWHEFWLRKRRKTLAATVALIIAMTLPSTKEAAIMITVPAIANSSIWGRLFGATDRDAMENAGKLVRDKAK